MENKIKKYLINEKKYYTNNLVITCRTFSNSKNWGHLAIAETKDGVIIKKAKMIYCNRTWETYTYEMVIFNLLSKIFKNKKELYEAKKEIDKQARNSIF